MNNDDSSSSSPAAPIPVIINNDEAKYTEGLDLSYITDRIIAMGCPYDPQRPDSALGKEKNDIHAVVRFCVAHFKPGTLRIWDLTTESTYDTSLFDALRSPQHPEEPVIVRRGFEDHHPAPMKLLWSILREMDAWLASDPQHVAIAHCMAGRGRTGLVISSYLLCSGICGTAAEALSLFAEKRGMNVKNGSQRRYVGYVEHQLLVSARKGAWPVPRALWVPPPEIPVHLSKVRLLSPPQHLKETSALETVPLESARFALVNESILPKLRCGCVDESGAVTFNMDMTFSGDLLFRVYGPKENSNPYTFRYQLAFRFVLNSFFMIELNGRAVVSSLAAIPELHGAVLQNQREFVINIDRQDLDGGLVGGLYDRRYSANFKVQLIASPVLSSNKL